MSPILHLSGSILNFLFHMTSQDVPEEIQESYHAHYKAQEDHDSVPLLPINNRREHFSYAATATFSGFLPCVFEGFSVTTGSGF